MSLLKCVFPLLVYCFLSPFLFSVCNYVCYSYAAECQGQIKDSWACANHLKIKLDTQTGKHTIIFI